MFTVVPLGSKLQDFITLFLGIVVEAFPFVILGVIVSILVALFVKEKTILKYKPKGRISSHFVMSILGFFMPVCECGNVPVARRLLLQGLSPSQTITFLLAAPIVNPITFYTTLEAFSVDKNVAFIRIIGGMCIAVAIGIVLSFKKNQNEFLTTKFEALCCDHTHEATKPLETITKVFRSEFFEVTKMLFIGAALAALSQVLIPRDVIASIGASPVLSILAMISLAFVVSICSNVDAFFALTYAHTFTLGSIMSFLLFGPMIDIKILTMLKGVFTTKALLLITTLVALLSMIVGFAINIFYKQFVF